MEPARGLGDLPQASAPGDRDRGRVHRRTAGHYTTRPRWAGDSPVPAGGADCCGICGRRLESTWSNGKPAYRCRHGHKSSSPPDACRPRNSYVREEQILPRLAAMAILLAGHDRQPDRELPAAGPQLTSPAETAELIDHLREQGLTLTYDSRDRTLRTGTRDPVALTL